MNELILATHNKNKVKEFKDIFSSHKIISLKDLGYFSEIEETGLTLEENALIKARKIYNYSKKNVISDDSGLEIEYLNGEPGVFSARYAGINSNSERNIKKVLEKLKNVKNRRARFRTVIAYKEKNIERIFCGSVNGKILNNKKGTLGFGYDPIFVPDGYDLSYSQMSIKLKNKVSHRYKAIKKLIDFINSK